METERYKADEALLRKRVILLCGENVTVDWWKVARLRFMNLAAAGVAPIHLYVQSSGGSARIGMEAYHFMRALKAPVHTWATGYVASAAIHIFLGGEKRLIAPSSYFHLHRPLMSVSELPLNAEFDGRLADSVGEVMEQERRAIRMIAERTGLTKKEVKRAMNEGDRFKIDRSADWLLDHGFATELVEKLPF